MALSGSILKDMILAKLQAGGIDTSNEFFKGAIFAAAVAEAVVEHLTTAGTVTVPGTGLVAPNGPVSGAATGTIS